VWKLEDVGEHLTNLGNLVTRINSKDSMCDTCEWNHSADRERLED